MYYFIIISERRELRIEQSVSVPIRARPMNEHEYKNIHIAVRILYVYIDLFICMIEKLYECCVCIECQHCEMLSHQHFLLPIKGSELGFICSSETEKKNKERKIMEKRERETMEITVLSILCINK